MDESVSKKLDELMSAPIFIRKVSLEKTDECPVWDQYDELWKESDAQFRDRILKASSNERS